MTVDYMRCTLVKEREINYDPITSREDAVTISRKLGLNTAADEFFYEYCLDAKGNIVGIHEVSHGTLSATAVHPREAFKRALLNNSASVIFVHNHPSGSTEPSQDDILTTERLKQAGDILGIQVLDHLIIAGDDYASVMEYN